MVNLCSTLSVQENNNVFGENFFASLPLIEHLKSKDIWYTGTDRTPSLKKCLLLAEKYLKQKASGSFYCHTDQSRKIVIANWFRSKAATLASSYGGVEPTDAVQG